MKRTILQSFSKKSPKRPRIVREVEANEPLLFRMLSVRIGFPTRKDRRG